MQLKARKKSQPSPELVKPNAVPEVAEAATPAIARQESSEITLRFDRMLYERLQNSLAASHVAGDFSYVSVSDVIRAAMRAYQDGMELTELAPSGNKKGYTLRIDAELRTFYSTLPNRLKSQIIERAVRSYMKEKMAAPL